MYPATTYPSLLLESCTTLALDRALSETSFMLTRLWPTSLVTPYEHWQITFPLLVQIPSISAIDVGNMPCCTLLIDAPFFNVYISFIN